MPSYKSVPLSPNRGGNHPSDLAPDPSKPPPKTHRFPFLHTRKGIIITVLVVLVIIGGGLAGLAALPKHRNGGQGGGDSGGGGGSGQITDDSYFYGQSPAVYPSREYLSVPDEKLWWLIDPVAEMSGLGTWADAYSKAKALVGKMTLDEKVRPVPCQLPLEVCPWGSPDADGCDRSA